MPETFRLLLKILLVAVFTAGTESCNRANVPDTPAAVNTAQSWDSAMDYMQQVNACYLACLTPEGATMEQYRGYNSRSQTIDDHTIFEGASLSKTVFAYLYWRLVNQGKLKHGSISVPVCGTGNTISISPSRLLSHTVACSDACVTAADPARVFFYSENGYLLLQQHVEMVMGKDLETLAREEVFGPLGMTSSTFVWHDSMGNFVNGFDTGDTPHRSMYKFTKPTANGSLYTCGQDLLLFAKALLNSSELDSMQVSMAAVPRFDKLSWGQGIGIEAAENQTWLWQWGSNWCYNNLLLLNTKDKSAFVCLSNSIIGAKRIRETCNFLYDRQFQLFNYISWY